MAGVDGFIKHTGRTAVYNEDDVDTDRIIPARYLTRVARSGYGGLLFSDVRGEGFALDQDDAKGASVLVVGTNFGCGSSREHAVWAIQQAGYKAVVARKDGATPGYSDIFRQNSANCGLLLVELGPAQHADIVSAGSGAEVTIDLVAQFVEVRGTKYSFDINPVLKDQLVAGLDLVGTTLVSAADIARFEKQWGSFAPSSPVTEAQRRIWLQMMMHRASRSKGGC